MDRRSNLRSSTFGHAIHRCYMTGQQCVYYRGLMQKEPAGVFLLSPFKAPFNHMFNVFWSALDLTDAGLTGKVRRADTIPRTGYVMCSRICYPIQQSALVMADVTEDNLNVFYELGIACALGKRILLVAHEGLTPPHVRAFLEASGLVEHTHFYPSTGTVASHCRWDWRAK